MKVELLTLMNEANEKIVREETSTHLTSTNGFLTIRTDKNPEVVNVDYRWLHDVLYDWCKEYMAYGEAQLKVEPVDGSYYRCVVKYKSMNAAGEVASMERYDSYFSPLYKLSEQLKADKQAFPTFAVEHNTLDHLFIIGYDDNPAIKATMELMVPELISVVGEKPNYIAIFKYEDRDLAFVLTDDSVGLLEIHQ